MLLATGTKLGPYEILAPLGAGGMGQVYRARDTRLGREAAIKILPEQLSGSPGFRQRFEREAKAISSLNHPNICTLYDVGETNGTEYLVLELLEGESLAERLQRGPLPPERVVEYGIQIADALECAHRRGVLHRDLKPGNIMVTKSGVKLLDFGLAKPFAGAAIASSAFTAMTASHESKPLTAEGAIVGTFQYIAPEQLEGHEADARGDIFALGCVLYEMATGRRAFNGKTQASVVAAILASEPPPINSLQPLTPPILERTVRLCLAKDPDERWQTAHDVKLQLKSIAEAGSQAGVPAPLLRRRRLRQNLAWMIAALATAIALAVTVVFFANQKLSPRPLRASLLPPKESSFDPFGFAVSPDGSKLAFVGLSKEKKQLWVRPLNSVAAQPLAGTDNATYPFWSPDSQSIGFFAEGKLKKIDAGGGPVITLAEAENGRGGTWNVDGIIVFSPKPADDGLYQVSAAGGTVTEAVHFQKERGEDTYRWPFLLPDGRHLIFYMSSKLNGGGGTNPNDTVAGTYFFDLKTKQKLRLANTDSGSQYANGYLFYLQQRNLMAQPFDASSGRFLGAAVPLAEAVQYEAQKWSGGFSVSNNGLLAYAGGEAVPTQLAWYNREGKEIGMLPAAGSTWLPNLSPDGRKVAVGVAPPGGNADIWVYDLARPVGTRLTYEPSTEESPVWSRDGLRVFYSTDRRSSVDIYSKASTGLGTEAALLESADTKVPNEWSPDGRTLIYMTFPGAFPQLWVHDTEPTKKDHPLLNTKFAEVNARFSPDGHWLAYSSNESGNHEVYAISYTDLSRKVQISTSGGYQPRWRKDGKEIYFISRDGKMNAVTVQTKAVDLAVGTPQPLFQTKIAQIEKTEQQYDVSPDGQRFLINTRPESASEPLTLYSNWQAELKK